MHRMLHERIALAAFCVWFAHCSVAETDEMLRNCDAYKRSGDLVEAFAWCFLADNRGDPDARPRLNSIEDILSLGDRSRGLKRADRLQSELRERGQSTSVNAPLKDSTREKRSAAAAENGNHGCSKDYRCVPFLSANHSYFSTNEVRSQAFLATELKNIDTEKLCARRFPGSFLARQKCKQGQLEQVGEEDEKWHDLRAFGTNEEKSSFVNCMENRKSSERNLFDVEAFNACLRSVR